MSMPFWVVHIWDPLCQSFLGDPSLGLADLVPFQPSACLPPFWASLDVTSCISFWPMLPFTPPLFLRPRTYSIFSMGWAPPFFISKDQVFLPFSYLLGLGFSHFLRTWILITFWTSTFSPSSSWITYNLWVRKIDTLLFSLGSLPLTFLLRDTFLFLPLRGSTLLLKRFFSLHFRTTPPYL